MASKKKPSDRSTAIHGPKPKYMMLGKSKFVHVVRTEAWDRKNSQCQHTRKMMVAGKIDYKGKGLSVEAALALDSCPACCTHETIAANQTPEQKREARKAARDEVLDRARGEAKQRKAEDAAVKKARKEADKAVLNRKASMTKSGPRSTASRAEGDPTQAKAKALADYAVECGWSSDIGKDDDTGHTVVRAVNGDAVIEAWFIDGKYDINRHAEIRVGSWTGKLRGAHAARRQMKGDDPVHPNPGKGRTGPRKKAAEDDVPEDESPVDAMRRVPFSLDDDALVIIDAVKGNRIRWRNGLSNVVEEAWLPASADGKKRSKIAVIEHPKTGRRMLNFLEVTSISADASGHAYEVYGPERTVYLDRIIRVVEG
jgi:hypothetical protein